MLRDVAVAAGERRSDCAAVFLEQLPKTRHYLGVLASVWPDVDAGDNFFGRELAAAQVLYICKGRKFAHPERLVRDVSDKRLDEAVLAYDSGLAVHGELPVGGVQTPPRVVRERFDSDAGPGKVAGRRSGPEFARCVRFQPHAFL